MPVLTVSGLDVRRPDGSELLRVASLSVGRGEVVTIMGPSGSGKTTLLNCVAGLVRPASGTILVSDVEVTALSSRCRSAFRLAKVGMLFQFGELLPELSVLQNVALPARLAGKERGVSSRVAHESLERLGLTDLADRTPTSLSGGEAQRVALARALAGNPELLLADEPTGMLDEENSEALMRIVRETCSSLGVAAVVVSHDPQVASAGDRTYRVSQLELHESVRQGRPGDTSSH